VGSPSTSGARISVSGCSGTGAVAIQVAAGAATATVSSQSSAASSSQSITVVNVPAVSLGAPSQATLSSSGTATLAVTYANSPTSTALTAATGTSASPPAGLTVAPTGTVSCSTIALAGPGGSGSPSTSGAQITVSGCNGNGTLTLQVSANAGSNSAGSSAASSSRSITITNTFSLAGAVVGNVNNSSQLVVGGTGPDTQVLATFTGGNGALAAASLTAATLYCADTTAHAYAGTNGTAIALTGPGNTGLAAHWTLNTANLATALGASETHCYLDVSGVTDTESSPLAVGSTQSANAQVTLAAPGAPRSISTGAAALPLLAVGAFNVNAGAIIPDNGLSITFSGAVSAGQASAITLHCTSDATYANSVTATGGTAISDLGSPTLSNGNATVQWTTTSGGNLLTAYNAGDTYCYLNVNTITGDGTSVNNLAKIILNNSP
jgi:hypothetical protein